jgi:hypothetical protein
MNNYFLLIVDQRQQQWQQQYFNFKYTDTLVWNALLIDDESADTLRDILTKQFGILDILKQSNAVQQSN